MKDFFVRHGIKILAVAAALAVGLSALSYLSDTSSAPRNALGVLCYPFRAASEAVGAFFTDMRQRYDAYDELLAENQALRLELADLREKERRAAQDRAENALLRELLSLRAQRRDFVFESAHVLDHGAGNWTHTLTLNRGTNHGVAVKNAVVSAEGYLVGVVTEAGSNWCVVRTVVDTDTELGARLFRTGDMVVAEGELALMEAERLRAVYLPDDTAILVGDYVVTSGLGGYYPSDLVIGTVERVETDDNGFAQYAVLAPMVDFDELRELFIIKSFDMVE